MIPATQTLKDAIASSAREPVFVITVTIGGTEYDWSDMVVDFSLDRTPQESVIRASQITGTTAAELNFTLRGWQRDPDDTGFVSSSDLSIYREAFSALRDNDYGIGAKVTARQGFKTPVGLETVQVFVGWVDGINVGDDGSVSFRCLDAAAKLQGKVQLPRIVNYFRWAQRSEQLPYTISSPVPLQGIAEYLMRSAGLYVTPPVLDSTVFSQAGIATEIGECTPRGQSLGGARGVNSGDYRFEPIIFGEGPVGSVLVMEDSFYIPTDMQWQPFHYLAQTRGLGLVYGWEMYGGRIYVSTPWGSLATGLEVSAGESHYLYLEIKVVEVPESDTAEHLVEAFVRLDDLTYYSGTISGSGEPRWKSYDNVRLNTLKAADDYTAGDVLSTFWWSQVRIESADTFIRTTREAWVPNVAAHYHGDVPAVLRVPHQSETAWEVLRQMASAYGARVRWDENGDLVWESRVAARSRMFSAAAQDLDGGRLIGSGWSYDAASSLTSVNVKWNEPEIYETPDDLNGAGFWNATEVVTIAASSVETRFFPIDAEIVLIGDFLGQDGELMRNKPNDLYVAPSLWRAVRAYQVGDPAAEQLRYWTIDITSRIVPGGVELTFTNTNPVDIAFWNPETQQPFLWLGGVIIRAAAAGRVYTSVGSPRAQIAYDLPDNPWRQSASEAVGMADTIAADGATPAIVFQNQLVVSDPLLTVDDVVAIQAPGLMDDSVPCQVVGIDYGIGENSLTVVPVVPPTGWVLGYPGRSELGTESTATTILVI